MSHLEIKDLVGKKIEHLKAKVLIKELQLGALLDITRTIQNDFTLEEVIEKFKYFVKDQLMIEQLALFSLNETWDCLFYYGFTEDELEQIDIERDVLHLKEITSVNAEVEDSLKYFDIVIPVYKGERPLAYLLLGDVNNEELNISKLIKHLNFLQLLTNLTVTAIENQRLAMEVLRQEKERREYMERQNEVLEGVVKVRTRELRLEKEESERLLYNILPVELTNELKQKGSITPHRYTETTVLFTDFKNFTATAANISPEKLVSELNQIFQVFDYITEKHSIEKIKTIGDSYMAVCGIPNESDLHAIQCVRAALDMIRFLEERKKKSGLGWEMRVGIHSGPLVAGVVGTKKFTYDVWGDTVNTASRMESSGVPGLLNISEATYQRIKDQYECEFRGLLAAKGKGELKMYFVVKETEREAFRHAKASIVKKLKMELPADLPYHGLHHTLDVCDVASGIALHEGMDFHQTELIKLAALLHDSGFIRRYTDNEVLGAELARELLPEFTYSEKDIETICGMIMATKIPQQPGNRMEEIMVDADLDYLGRTDYTQIAQTLQKELSLHGKPLEEREWMKMQIDFLSKHSYFTNSSRKLRNSGKQRQLDKLMAGYSP
ncbi:MAG: adenylate/guanylate cyclase domain-containing protein [Bacteroidia bacterium]